MTIGLKSVDGTYNMNFGSSLQCIALYRFLKDTFPEDKILLLDEKRDSGKRDLFGVELETTNDPAMLDKCVVGSDCILYANESDNRDAQTDELLLVNRPELDKVLYAVGSECPQSSMKEKYRDFLSKMSAVSIRDMENAQFIPNSIVNIDPTLLFEMEWWEKMLKKPDFVGDGEIEQMKLAYSPWFKHDDTGWFKYPDDCVQCYNHPGIKSPFEFLWLLRNCREVWSYSFHAFIFSLMFNKRIIDNGNHRGNFKVRNLINLLGARMENGLCVNRDEVMDNLKKEQEKSRRYIMEMVKNGYTSLQAGIIYTNIVQKSPQKSKFFNCQAKNKAMLNMSSSGGISGVLAEEILSRGGVVYGARFSSDFRSVKVDWVDSIGDYFKQIAKSKYVFSVPPKFTEIKERLDKGRLVFAGLLPCQTVALGKFLGRSYENLYVASVKCHGATQMKFWSEFVDRIEFVEGSKVVSMDFRKNHITSLIVKFENGVQKDYGIDKFMNNNTEKCMDCKVKWNNDFADFIIGDYWEANKNKDTLFNPELSVKDGISFLRINSEKGLKLFDDIKCKLLYKEFDNSKIQY